MAAELRASLPACACHARTSSSSDEPSRDGPGPTRAVRSNGKLSIGQEPFRSMCSSILWRAVREILGVGRRRATAYHPVQKRCPQAVMRGSRGTSKQMPHSALASCVMRRRTPWSRFRSAGETTGPALGATSPSWTSFLDRTLREVRVGLHLRIKERKSSLVDEALWAESGIARELSKAK